MTTPQSAVRSKRLWFVMLCLLLCGLGSAAFTQQKGFLFRPQPSVQPPQAPVKLLAIHALGRLEPAGTVVRVAQLSGNEGATVADLVVQEGQDVQTGDTLAVLDNAVRRQAALREAKANVCAAEAKLSQVRAGAKSGDIAAQQALVDMYAEQIRVADKEAQRARQLFDKNALPIEAADQKQWALDQARFQHQRAVEQLVSLKEVRETDVRIAEREVAVGQAAEARAQADLAASYVKAPQAGRVLKIHTHQGERVGDQGLLELGDVLHMEAVAEVFEADLSCLELGLPATVRVDGLEADINGEVCDIGHRVARKVVLTNDPVSDTDARVVEVRIRLNETDVEQVVRLTNARVEVQIQLPPR